MNDKSIRPIEKIQNYGGERMQQHIQRAPKVYEYVGLGWIRSERFIEIEKIIFCMVIS